MNAPRRTGKSRSSNGKQPASKSSTSKATSSKPAASGTKKTTTAKSTTRKQPARAAASRNGARAAREVRTTAPRTRAVPPPVPDPEPIEASMPEPEEALPATPAVAEKAPVPKELVAARVVLGLQAALTMLLVVFAFMNVSRTPNSLGPPLREAQDKGRITREVGDQAKTLDRTSQRQLVERLDEKGSVTAADVKELASDPAVQRRAEGRQTFATFGAIFLFVFVVWQAGSAYQIGRAKWRIGTAVLEGLILLPTVIAIATGNFGFSVRGMIAPLLAVAVLVLIFSPGANRAFLHTKNPTLYDAGRFDIRSMPKID